MPWRPACAACAAAAAAAAARRSQRDGRRAEGVAQRGAQRIVLGGLESFESACKRLSL